MLSALGIVLRRVTSQAHLPVDRNCRKFCSGQAVLFQKEGSAQDGCAWFRRIPGGVCRKGKGQQAVKTIPGVIPKIGSDSPLRIRTSQRFFPPRDSAQIIKKFRFFVVRYANPFWDTVSLFGNEGSESSPSDRRGKFAMGTFSTRSLKNSFDLESREKPADRLLNGSKRLREAQGICIEK